MSRCMTDTDNLTAVADAIRTKGGTSAQLVYPAGFVSAIQAIQTGVTPKLVVTTSAGAAVTAIKGSKTVSGTAGTDGTCTLEIPEAGEWSVTSTANGLSDTQSIVIGTQSMSLFSVDPVFANNSWAGVVTACRRGNVPSTWVVGDSMPMTIGGTDYQVDIIGKSHDDYYDGSGKAPLTFQLHDCYGTGYGMNDTETVVGGWKSSKMRTEYLPSILALMPESVKNGIREVSKKNAATSSSIVTSADKLFLLSEIEIFGSRTISAAGEGTQYSYYANGNMSGGEKVKTMNRLFEKQMQDILKNEYLDHEMDNAVTFFSENYNQNINIDDYAASRGMSVSWFIRNFKKYTGSTPMQFIVGIRINNAQMLLETTTYSINEISKIIGYDNQLYFSRLFHKLKGYSPREYRKLRNKF